MKISVIIPTHNPKYLNNTLHGLFIQENKDFDVIVCENPTVTKEVEKTCSNFSNVLDIALINSNIGANNARNTGVYLSGGDIIALLDDDCVPSKTWIDEIYKTFKDDKVSCVGGRVNIYGISHITALQAQYLTKIDWGHTETHRQLLPNEYLASCNLAFTREVYAKVGGFNANLGYFGKNNFIPNDEVLFIRDCANHGKVCYNDNMLVDHNVLDRVNMKFFLKRAYGQGYANILLEREQGITGNCHQERVYYSENNKTDINLQIAKHIGMLHAIKGIEPSGQFYSLLEELVQI